MNPEMIRVTCAATASEAGADGVRTLSGRIATYGQTVTPHGPWPAVRLAAGALNVPEQSSRVKLMYGHNDSVIGSLADTGVTTDGDVVTASFRLANTAAADDAHSLVRDGHVDGLSVGYMVRDGQQVIEDGSPVFEVTAADLIEVSIVPFPADAQARVSDVTAQKGRTMTVTEPQDRGVVDVGPDARRTAQEISDAVRAALAELAPQYSAPAVPPGAPVVQAQDTVTADGYGRYLPGYTTRNGMHVTAGDYLSAVIKMRDGDGEAYARIAAADDLTTLVPGLLPVQIMQPVIDTISDIRPLFESCTLRVMPTSGNKFQRPTIKTHVAVGEQATELTAVPSQAMEVSLDDVTKRTIAGSLRLSVQSLDWSSPALLDLVIADFARVYAKWTEQDTSTNFAASAKGTPIVIPVADRAAAMNKAFYTASAASWKAGGIMANRVWMSLDMWAELGGQTDANGRPLYPFFGNAQNAAGDLSPAAMISGGGNVGSYRPVVAPYLPDGSLFVGPSQYSEVYEDRRGMLRVADPSALGQVIAWYGYIASYTAVGGKPIIPLTLAPPVKG